MMVKWMILVSVVVLSAGCGSKPDPIEPTGQGRGNDPPGGNDSGQMVPPEVIDEIDRLLGRKRGIMSRCLAIAVDNRELPRNSRGKVTVALVIDRSGKPGDVKVVRSTLESGSLSECVVRHILSIQFPTVPGPFPTSYVYGLESM